MIAATIGPNNRTFISSWRFTQRLRSLTDSSFFWNPKCRRDGDKILIHDREHHSRINKDNRNAGIEKSDNFQIALLVQKGTNQKFASAIHQTRKYKCPAKSQKWETCNQRHFSHIYAPPYNSSGISKIQSPLHKCQNKQNGQNTSLTKYPINRNRNQKQKNSQKTCLHRQRTQLSGSFQNGCFTSSQNREENGWCQENEMQRMIAPGKVNPLSNGPRRTQTMAPKNAASRLQVRTRRTAPAISAFSDCDSSAACSFSEINLTPLVGMPKLHAELRTEIVELKRDSSPIPEGPRKSAVNLLRKTPTRIPNPCTLPNNPVYFRICE